MIFNVAATIQLTFDSEDGLVKNKEQAIEEMYDFLDSGVHSSQFDIDVIEED